MKITVIGLGYVGLPLSIEFAKHFEVIGFDINSLRVTELNNGIDETKEIDSAAINSAKKLSFTSNEDDIKGSDFYIVTVPTPIDSSKKPNLEPVINASELISRSMSNGAIVIYESTVFPGCTEEVCVPILERSGLKFNEEFFCGYSPERIVPGDKENTLTNIKKIVSGSNSRIASKINDLYKVIIKAGTHLAPSIRVAEAAKVIENTQRDMNIAIINEFSMVFDSLGIDTKSVLEAASTKWNFIPFSPGLVGGHCIGVDPYYLISKSIESGYVPELLITGRKINDEMHLYLARKIKSLNDGSLADLKIGVLGLAFKANTSDIRNTKILDLIEIFDTCNSQVSVCDPIVIKEQALNEFNLNVHDYLDDSSFDIIIHAVNHNVFNEYNLLKINKLFRGSKKILVDINAIFSFEDAQDLGIKLLRL